MEYRNVNGPVYCRYAFTPPVINSDLAYEYGIQAPSHIDLVEGRNVKLRMILDDRSLRITCHGKIDWVKKDEAGGELRVGLSHLSLSDQEFGVLMRNFSDGTDLPLEFGEQVRDKGLESEPFTSTEPETEIERIKAVSLPLAIIEAIDMKRGSVSFSKFVAQALRDYLD